MTEENKNDVTNNNNSSEQNDTAEAAGGCIEPIVEDPAEILASITSRFDRIDDTIQQLWQRCESRAQRLERYLEIVAECQRETAKFANNQFDRHALHPAIEALDTLRRQIQDSLEQTSSLPDSESLCPYVRLIADFVKQAARIADAKCRALGIETIEPKELDDLDADRHEVRQAVPASDPGQHKKIYKTLIPGLLYRGNVLRQARVSVYRHITNPTTESKGEHNEPQNK